MTDTIITVQGQHSAWYPAERATVHVSIHSFGPKRDAVFERAVASAAIIRESIEALLDKTAGPVTWWSADDVRVWSERPWNSDGKQLPPVVHAALDVTAKFSDFEALATWIEATVEVTDAVVNGIDWDVRGHQNLRYRRGALARREGRRRQSQRLRAEHRTAFGHRDRPCGPGYARRPGRRRPSRADARSSCHESSGLRWRRTRDSAQARTDRGGSRRRCEVHRHLTWLTPPGADATPSRARPRACPGARAERGACRSPSYPWRSRVRPWRCRR